MNKPEYSYKVVLLGSSCVGKTSIVMRYTRGVFDTAQNSTIGAGFFTKSIETPDVIINYEIWDTAGQERYRSLTPLYYRKAVVAFIVFDISNYDSFNTAKTWINELKNNNSNDIADIIILLVGNKCDLDHTVSQREIDAIVHQMRILYIETSAKDDYNIAELFSNIVRRLPKTEKYRKIVHEPVCKIVNKSSCCSNILLTYRKDTELVIN